MTTCPTCGASVQADASFCGQCGFSLQGTEMPPAAASSLPATVSPDFEVPDLTPPDPLVEPDPLAMPSANPPQSESPSEAAVLPEVLVAPAVSSVASAPSPMVSGSGGSKTQLQTQIAQLLHVQTNTSVELPVNLAVIHIGKPNDRIPPDIDVSGFPNSEIVSRIHADIRVEGDIYYIEDVGSSNGTYINNAPLPSGNRHRLRPGDRIALGKGDKVTFLFQIS